MSNAVIILQLLATYGPDIAEMAQRILSRGKDPTPQEWAELFARARKGYDAYINEAQARLDASK